MPTVIDAALIGDSHCRAIEAAAEAQGVTFRHTITGASPLFLHAAFTTAEDGDLAFSPAPSHFDPATQPEKAITNKRAKTRKLTQGFRALFAEPVPVFITIGTGAHAFVSRITTAQDSARLTDPFVSSRLARKAASEFFADYRALYQVIAQACPQVACLYAPTRFTDRTRDLWLTYDDNLEHEMLELGVEILDMRRTLGDDTLHLRPEYHVDNPDDQVHANPAWGAAVLDAIRAHPFLTGAR